MQTLKQKHFRPVPFARIAGSLIRRCERRSQEPHPRRAIFYKLVAQEAARAIQDEDKVVPLQRLLDMFVDKDNVFGLLHIEPPQHREFIERFKTDVRQLAMMVNTYDPRLDVSALNMLTYKQPKNPLPEVDMQVHFKTRVKESNSTFSPTSKAQAWQYAYGISRKSGSSVYVKQMDDNKLAIIDEQDATGTYWFVTRAGEVYEVIKPE